MSRSKAIGTQAESAVVRVARTHGFPQAERRALHGATDLGDILLCPGIVIEVKGGAAAKDASDGDIERWLGETERERVNAGAEVAFLVTQRRGVGAPNAHRWWAHWRLGWINHRFDLTPSLPIRMTLGDALRLLRAAGWGEADDREGEG